MSQTHTLELGVLTPLSPVFAKEERLEKNIGTLLEMNTLFDSLLFSATKMEPIFISPTPRPQHGLNKPYSLLFFSGEESIDEEIKLIQVYKMHDWTSYHEVLLQIFHDRDGHTMKAFIKSAGFFEAKMLEIKTTFEVFPRGISRHDKVTFRNDEGLQQEVGVEEFSKKYLHSWVKKHPQFKDIVKKIFASFFGM